MSFERNVFVNCPFDEDYATLLRPLLFTLLYLGFKPRISLERLDSGETRLAKIIELIEASQYAIHDLSRIRATKKGEYFRLNMPFELGIDVGCRLFKRGKSAQKRCLILVSERYQYQAAISDLSNSDVANHEGSPMGVVIETRNWLSASCGLNADGPSRIWDSFNVFMGANYDALKERGFSDQDIQAFPVAELIDSMRKWIEANS